LGPRRSLVPGGADSIGPPADLEPAHVLRQLVRLLGERARRRAEALGLRQVALRAVLDLAQHGRGLIEGERLTGRRLGDRLDQPGQRLHQAGPGADPFDGLLDQAVDLLGGGR